MAWFSILGSDDFVRIAVGFGRSSCVDSDFVESGYVGKRALRIW